MVLACADLEEIYEQLTRWLDEPEENKLTAEGDSIRRRKIRDNTVVQFAESLLKRTLSESFVGVPLTDGVLGDEYFDENFVLNGETADRVKTVVRSLSLELAKHKHLKWPKHVKSAAENEFGASNTVITGNWGCGSRHLGDPQLKLLIQWLAASVADTPRLVYYTCNHRKLLKVSKNCNVGLSVVV